jgi:hypothetical protein
VPVKNLGDPTARENTDGAARRSDEAVDAYRPRLFPGVGKHRDDDAEHNGRSQCAADALHEPRGDQHRLVRSEAACDRGCREHSDPDEEQTSPAEQVAEPAGEK